MSIDNLLDLIIQYKEAAQLIETAQAEQETIKAQIKAEMAQRNTNDLQVGCHKVKLSDFTSTRLDSKAIKAVAPGSVRPVFQSRYRPAPDHQLRKAPCNSTDQSEL